MLRVQHRVCQGRAIGIRVQDLGRDGAELRGDRGLRGDDLARDLGGAAEDVVVDVGGEFVEEEEGRGGDGYLV